MNWWLNASFITSKKDEQTRGTACLDQDDEGN